MHVAARPAELTVDRRMRNRVHPVEHDVDPLSIRFHAREIRRVLPVRFADPLEDFFVLADDGIGDGVSSAERRVNISWHGCLEQSSFDRGRDGPSCRAQLPEGINGKSGEHGVVLFQCS